MLFNTLIHTPHLFMDILYIFFITKSFPLMTQTAPNHGISDNFALLSVVTFPFLNFVKVLVVDNIFFNITELILHMYHWHN